MPATRAAAEAQARAQVRASSRRGWRWRARGQRPARPVKKEVAPNPCAFQARTTASGRASWHRRERSGWRWGARPALWRGASSSFLLGPQERQGKSKTRPIWRKWTHANVCLNKLCEPSQISNSYRSFYLSANTKKPPILLLKDLPPWRFGLGHPTQPRAALGRVGVDGASGLSTASAAPR